MKQPTSTRTFKFTKHSLSQHLASSPRKVKSQKIQTAKDITLDDKTAINIHNQGGKKWRELRVKKTIKKTLSLHVLTPHANGSLREICDILEQRSIPSPYFLHHFLDSTPYYIIIKET